MPTPNPFVPVKVTVAQPPRGAGTQPTVNFIAQSFRGTFAWGSNPGTATIVYVGTTAPATIGALVRIEAGSHIFYGMCKSDVGVQATTGYLRTLEFVDLRDFLTWDYIACAFNIKDSRYVNGQWVRRYKHLYPANYNSWLWTYTDAPLAGYQIMAAIFSYSFLNGGPIGSPWTYDLTGNGEFTPLMNLPIYDVDFTNGERLDSALNKIASEMGLVYGLFSSDVDPYHLVFTRKGFGSVLFPEGANDRRIGSSLTGNATNLRILGDRNLFMALDLVMEKDWSVGWESFLDVEVFVNDIYERATDPLTGARYNAFPGDTDKYYGRLRAAARAREITVREYATLRGGSTDFIDTRKYAGRSRMDMPAALYIETLVFRAFRPQLPGSIGVDWDIVPRMLARVTHDASTGDMSFFTDEPTDGTGYAVVKGFQVGNDLFRAFKPEQIDVNFFKAANATYANVSFSIDDSGEGQRFIIFDEPVFTCENLFTRTNGHVSINAGFTLTVPQVRAALTFAGPRFSYWQGTYPAVSRDAVHNVANLNQELVVKNGVQTEVPYRDGKFAVQKANDYATTFLLRQYAYVDGGYKVPWNPITTAMPAFGTQLRSMVDRVEVVVAPGEGIYEIVDFATERSWDSFQPERDLERRTQISQLFPGQQRLRNEADDFRRLAAGLKAVPAFGRWLAQVMRGQVGQATPVQLTWFNGASGTVVAGTPVWKVPTTIAAYNTNTLPAFGASVTAQHKVFVGVTVRDAENATKPVYVQGTGVVPARVLGPVNENDSIGWVQGQTYFAKDGNPSVGKVLQKITGASTELVLVVLGGGGGSSGVNYRGDWSPTESYKKYDIVRVRSGTSKGVWIMVADAYTVPTAPIWPEPAATGGTNTWDNITQGVFPFPMCGPGGKYQDVNASAPYTPPTV